MCIIKNNKCKQVDVLFRRSKINYFRLANHTLGVQAKLTGSVSRKSKSDNSKITLFFRLSNKTITRAVFLITYAASERGDINALEEMTGRGYLKTTRAIEAFFYYHYNFTYGL